MDLQARLFQRSLSEFHQAKVAFIPAPPPQAPGGAPPGGDPSAAAGAPPGGDPSAAGAPPAPGGAPMGDPSAGAPPAAPEGGAPGPDMLDAIGGGSPEGALPEGMPPEGAEPAPEDPMAPTPEGAKDTANPSDSVTRGQADVTMDIVERTLSAVGEGRTKEQAKAEFDLEQQGKTKEQERKDSEASAKAAAGPITGQPSTPGGPLGALGGQIDPNSIGGVPKLAREGLFKKG